MSQLQRGETFIDGQVVTAARLNNLVDLATTLNGLIMDRGISAVTSNDQVLLWDDSTNALRRASVQTLIASAVGVTSVALTMPGGTFNITGSPITTTGTLAVTFDTQAKNKVLIGPESGAAAVPTWRVLSVKDKTTPPVNIAAAEIDWSLGNCFTKYLTAHFTPSFSNPTEGQSITVRLQNAGGWYTNWDYTGVKWPGGVSPYPGTLDANHSDIFYFIYTDGLYFGTYSLNYF